jgi:L-threonylcarbamoyladenylate synthase
MEEIKNAIEQLERGEVICFPTETVYALACDAANNDAIEKIYALKKRTHQKPLAVFVSDLTMMEQIAFVTDDAKKLYKNFMPGEITIILQSKNTLAPNLNKINDTLAIRIPKHDLAYELVKNFGKPIAATSANISGEENADIEGITKHFAGKVQFFIKGSMPKMQSSTIVDLTSSSYKILRIGGVSEAQIKEVLDEK